MSPDHVSLMADLQATHGYPVPGWLLVGAAAISVVCFWRTVRSLP